MFDSVQTLLGEVLACGAPMPAGQGCAQGAGELSDARKIARTGA